MPASFHPRMILYIGTTCSLEPSFLILFDGLRYGPAHPYNHIDPRRSEGLVCIGATVSRQNGLDTFLGHKLCRLDARPSTQGDVRIHNSFKAHILRVYDHKISAPSKTGIKCSIQIRFSCSYCYFHFFLLQLFYVPSSITPISAA